MIKKTPISFSGKSIYNQEMSIPIIESGTNKTKNKTAKIDLQTNNRDKFKIRIELENYDKKPEGIEARARDSSRELSGFTSIYIRYPKGTTVIENEQNAYFPKEEKWIGLIGKEETQESANFWKGSEMLITNSMGTFIPGGDEATKRLIDHARKNQGKIRSSDLEGLIQEICLQE